MTHQTEPLALLRDTEHYLSALHGSVARHDNLAANYGCAGCELRDRIAAALLKITAAASAAVAPPTDQTALRGRIAEALMQWAEGNNSPKYTSMRRPETVVQNAYSRADAVLAVLPEPADRAAVLREAADALATLRTASEPNGGYTSDYERGTRDALLVGETKLRRMADETASETPDARTCPPDCPCHAVCIGPAAGARQDGTES
ncbi:hypothetical protein ACFY7X_13615 [Streptomyces althioticus]|uniref:hypothetical protein n=1 Tax=Streptomyces althioticus TaxID=83380 RepID=UPI0033CD2D34